MTKHILIDLRSWLQKEAFDHDSLGGVNVDRLVNDIIKTIKSTDVQMSGYNSSSSVYDLLENFAASTDKERIKAGKANIRNIGLIRKKVPYVSPVAAAEKRVKKDMVEDMDLKSSEEDEWFNIKNILEGTATKEEYERNTISDDTLTLFLEGRSTSISIHQVYNQKKWRRMNQLAFRLTITEPIQIIKSLHLI